MVLVTAVMLWAVVTWPPIRCLVYAAWMTPLGELALLVIGQLWFRFHYREAPPGAFTRLIIQVTTTGHEHERVTEIIRQIRDYQLTMNYQIWVVTEPGSRTDYQLADLVVIVPRDFSARSAKAEARTAINRNDTGRRLTCLLGRPRDLRPKTHR